MKYAIAFCILTAFAQFVVVPSIETGSVAQSAKSHAKMIEEATK